MVLAKWLHFVNWRWWLRELWMSHRYLICRMIFFVPQTSTYRESRHPVLSARGIQIPFLNWLCSFFSFRVSQTDGIEQCHFTMVGGSPEAQGYIQLALPDKMSCSRAFWCGVQITAEDWHDSFCSCLEAILANNFSRNRYGKPVLCRTSWSPQECSRKLATSGSSAVLKCRCCNDGQEKPTNCGLRRNATCSKH